MKISLLKKRENFESIFSESVINYFLCRFNEDVKLSWKPLGGAGGFVTNDLLNVIYPSEIDRRLLAPLTQEFSWHKSAIRRIAQKCYVFLAVRYPFENLFCSQKIWFQSVSVNFCNLVFIPGNHSIRVIDVTKNKSVVFYKVGFNKELTVKDAQVRLDYPFLTAPKVLEHDFANGWYEEERVIGMPLNRLSDNELKSNTLAQCQEDLLSLYRATSFKKDIKDYLVLLKKKLAIVLGKGDLTALSRDDVVKLSELIMSKLNEVGTQNISVAVTHGDFQSANILCTSSGYWIIDWEYSEERSVFYDALVFETNVRCIENLATRLTNVEKKLTNGSVFCKWLENGINDESKFYLYLFLLEDLILRVAEVATPGVTGQGLSIAAYIDEMFKFVES